MNPPPISSQPVKSSSRGCLLYSCIVIATFLLVFLTACVITYVMPKKYESNLIYQVRPSPRLLQTITPQFFATEFEVIKANMTLKPVVQRLDLAPKWNMTEDDAIAVLRGIVSSQNIHGTDLIQIKVRHTDPVQARDIAMEVFESYKKRRDDKEREIIDDSRKELEKAIVDQADVVEEKRKQRDNLLTRSNGNASDPTVLEVQKEFETQMALLENMREKFGMDQLILRNISMIELHEEPLVPQYPSSPNVTLNLIMGATLGLLFGLLMALFVRVVFGRRISC
jgi:capsular polysaccharide biosynthesis protein